MKTLKYRKTRGKKLRKSSKMRKSRKSRKSTMKGGANGLLSLLSGDLARIDKTLNQLDADSNHHNFVKRAHAPALHHEQAPGLNVGEPGNRPYTGYGWLA